MHTGLLHNLTIVISIFDFYWDAMKEICSQFFGNTNSLSPIMSFSLIVLFTVIALQQFEAFGESVGKAVFRLIN